MRKDDGFSLSTHSLRTVVYIRKEVLYGIVKKSVKIRKLFLYAFFTGSLGIRKFEISCCVYTFVVDTLLNFPLPFNIPVILYHANTPRVSAFGRLLVTNCYRTTSRR